ncbi:hypothetical protein AVEN_184307-1 [Araneus ventricosus]|uniref:Uncharacterized protein n=1 Tax=Araneus ventricosus TaxID=182803 RepID=A0A4Y2KBS0_ARAVE|nr:hypothetical protein AVEN_184307-1 [Araneus ventricosus]
MQVLEEERERCGCFLERQSPAVKTLGIKAVSGITLLLGLLALRPNSESVDPCRTRKLSKEVCFSDAIRGNSTETETDDNRGITLYKERV